MYIFYIFLYYRSTNCSQCSTSNSTSHPIFLNIDRTKDNETIINELKTKLNNSNDKVNDFSVKLEKANEEINKLKANVAEKQKKFEQVQKLYKTSEDRRTQFEDIIKNLTKENENIKSCLSININSKTQQDTDSTIEELEQRISKLSAENIKLKEIINKNESSTMVLNYKNEMLEKRLKHLTLELKNVIAENINKSIEYLDYHQIEDEEKREDTNTLNHMLETTEDLNNSLEDLNLERHEKQIDTHSQKLVLAHPSDTKISINGFPRNELVFPLEFTILLLASKMSISITLDEILHIKMKNSTVYPDKVGLLVEFKTVNTKMEFLQHKHILRSHPSTKYIQIKEYIDENIFSIFTYANQNLRSRGYGYIYCKNNQVYVKKSVYDVEEIAIKDKSHVDRLIAGTKMNVIGR